MSKLKLYDYYLDLPPWARGVVVIGGALVVYLVGSRLVKAVFPSAEERKNKELWKNIDREIIDARNNGQKESYVESQYKTFANTIYESMRYAVGDDYGTVVETMKKMKNDIDVAKLIKAFDVRQDYFFGLPEGSPKDLFTFVQSELGQELGVFNFRIDQINSDWKKKGITYQL